MAWQDSPWGKAQSQSR